MTNQRLTRGGANGAVDPGGEVRVHAVQDADVQSQLGLFADDYIPVTRARRRSIQLRRLRRGVERQERRGTSQIQSRQGVWEIDTTQFVPPLTRLFQRLWASHHHIHIVYWYTQPSLVCFKGYGPLTTTFT